MSTIGVLVLAVSPMFVASGVSQAGTATPGNAGFTAPYNRVWTFKSRPLRVCVAYRVIGKITYTVNTTGHGGWVWRNQKLNDPTLSANVWRYRLGKCNSTHVKLSDIHFAQYWTGYSCSFNPSLGVGVPFAISLSGWPSCGNRITANYPDYNPSSQSVYKQNNTGGVKVTFAEYVANTEKPGPCYGVYVSSRIRIGGSDDSFASSVGKVCLPG
jgi:hypothetical protein